MALAADCDQIANLCARIIQLERFLAQQTSVFLDNPDLDLVVPTSEKTRLQGKEANLQNQIKQIVRAW